jgi:sugar (pentulose or hexulose) kinase
MRPLLLGIDVGTSSCKAAVLDTERGQELAHGRVPTPWQRVGSGAEIDPHALFAAARRAASEALAGGPPGRVLALGVTSMAEAGVLLGDDGDVLYPAIAWHDERGAEQAAAFGEHLGHESFSRRTGLPVSELCSLAKLRWLIDHGRLAGAPRRWCNVAEWVVRGLGGAELSELSLASRTGLLDLGARAPYSEALAWAGLPDDLLGELVPSGTAAGAVRKAVLPGAGGAVLTVAGMDHLCAGVGVGVLSPGDVLDSCGTAEALVRVLAPPLAPERVAAGVAAGFTVGWHLAPDRQALLGALWSGLALQKVLDELGLTVPVQEPVAAWIGAVRSSTGDAARMLSVMDGLVGPRRRIVATGGWTHDATVMAAKRRLGAVPAPAVSEAGARGAGLIGGVAAGVYPGLDRLPGPEA